MKNKKIGSITMFIGAIVLGLILVACPSTSSDSTNGIAFSGTIYDNGFAGGFADPAYWNVDETQTDETMKARGFVTGPETTKVAPGKTESFKVDWSQATDWMGLAVNVGSGTTSAGTFDLSAYNALSITVMAEAEGTQIDTFGFGADATEVNAYGDRYKVELQNVDVPTTGITLTIPLPNKDKLKTVNNLFYTTDGANGGTIYLSEVKFVNDPDLVVKSFTYNGAASLDVTDLQAIGDLAVTFTTDATDATKDITPVVKNLAAYVDWISADPTIATVDADGIIQGKTSGSTVLTGRLGGIDVTINATVTVSEAFAGTVFDDALQGGFAAKMNIDGTGESDASLDTAVYAGASGSSIKFELPTSGTWGGGYVQNDSGVDASAYTSLSFDVKSDLDASVNFLQFKLEDTAGGATNDALNLLAFTPMSTLGDWKSYTVYLSNYSAIDFSKFKAIGFWHPRAAGAYTPGTFYVDNIVFGTDESAATFTVTYEGNGNDGGTLSKVSDTGVKDGATIADAPTGITRAGYTFSGWNSKMDGSGFDFVFGVTPVMADMTLYAQWAMEVANEPTDAPTAPTAADTDVTSLYSDAYTDIQSNRTPGWGEVVTEETIANNKVLKTTNFVPFDIGSSTNFSSKNTIHVDVWLPTLPTAGAGLLIKLVDTTTATPAVTGEAIYPMASLTAGTWNSVDVALDTFKEGGTTVFSNLTTVDQVLVDIVDDATMYVDNVYFYTSASSGTEYTVTYDANAPSGLTVSGTLSKSSDTVTDGDTVAEAPTGLSITGYSIVSWNIEADGTGTDFEFGTTTVTADITLYAQWLEDFVATIFDDALKGGFFALKLLGPNGDASLADVDTTVYAGASGSSLKFDLTGSTVWGGGYIHRGTGVDASSHTSLTFDVNNQLDSSVDFLQFKLEDTAGGATADTLNLYDLTATATNGDWETYTITLADYSAVDFTKFQAIGFWHPKAGGSEGTYTPGAFYIDNIMFQ